MTSANEELRLNGGVIPDYYIADNIPRISVTTGASAPAATPDNGDIYINTTNSVVYIGTPAGWKIITNTV